MESPGHRWESDEYLSGKPVQRGQATQWEVWCQIREKLRFVADQNRPSPGNRLEVVTFSVLILIIPWWIWHSFGRIESHFSLLMLTRFPWYIDTLSFPVDCVEAFSMFDHSYLIIRVLRFLHFHAPFLSTSRSIFEHIYSRGYLSMLILFPRIGDTCSIPIFAPASLPAFFCISWRKIPDNEAILSVL